MQIPLIIYFVWTLNLLQRCLHANTHTRSKSKQVQTEQKEMQDNEFLIPY